MNLDRRLGLYGLAFVILLVIFIRGFHAEIELKVQTDPSARAILSFSFVYWAIFAAQAMACVVPAAGVIEVLIWMLRHKVK